MCDTSRQAVVRVLRGRGARLVRAAQAPVRSGVRGVTGRNPALARPGNPGRLSQPVAPGPRRGPASPTLGRARALAPPAPPPPLVAGAEALPRVLSGSSRRHLPPLRPRPRGLRPRGPRPAAAAIASAVGPEGLAPPPLKYLLTVYCMQSLW